MARKHIVHLASPALSETTDHRVSLYSLVAAAAGVSVLALAQPADAEVIVTHKTIPIPIDSETGTLVTIDFNHDGINDVSFGFTSFGPYYRFRAEVFVVGQPDRGVITKGKGPEFPLVSALLRGDKVGPSAHFSSAVPDAFLEQFSDIEEYSKCSKLNSYGHWAGNNPDRFVGVRFLISGETHYGWVRVTVATAKVGGGCRRMIPTITAYAYETVANKVITIGDHSDSSVDGQSPAVSTLPDRPSLGMLALGAEGLALWRRDESDFLAQGSPVMHACC